MTPWTSTPVAAGAAGAAAQAVPATASQNTPQHTQPHSRQASGAPQVTPNFSQQVQMQGQGAPPPVGPGPAENGMGVGGELGSNPFGGNAVAAATGVAGQVGRVGFDAWGWRGMGGGGSGCY